MLLKRFLRTTLAATLATTFGWSLPTATASAQQLTLKTHRQIFESLALVTGIDPTDAEVAATYAESRARLPQQGALEEISSPMLLAATSLSGIFCKKLIAADALKPSAERRAHRHIDFQSPFATISRLQRLQLVREYAEIFWQRSPSDSELEAMLEAFGYANEPLPMDLAGRMTMLLTGCTSAASSIHSLVY